MMMSLINRFRLVNQTSLNRIRLMSTNVSSSKTESETNLNEILKKRFPNARLIDVKDTSCKYRDRSSEKMMREWREEIISGFS